MNESKSPIEQAWHKHPIVKGVAGVAVFVAVAEILIYLIPPAWAVTVPVTDRITIDLGEAAQLVTALVAGAGLWRAWKAEKKAAEAAASATAGVAKIEAVAVQIDGLLAARDLAKFAEGKKEEKQAGEVTAAALAQGQREGVASERASVATQAIPAVPTEGGKGPLPVADDRTAGAAERSAAALERSATAEEKKP